MKKKSNRVSARKQALGSLKFQDAQKIYADFLKNNNLDSKSIANEEEILSSINSSLAKGKVDFKVNVKFKKED